MIEHISLPCSKVKESRGFYEKALAPLGYQLSQDFGEAVGFMAEGHTSFWISKAKLGDPTHLAFRARSRAAVDRFYQAALAAGGKDNGKPGLRKENGPNYYAAFVHDPDGHNIEAVSFAKGSSRPKSSSKPSSRTKR